MRLISLSGGYVHGMMDGEAFDLQRNEKEAFESKYKNLDKEAMDAKVKSELRMLRCTFELQ